MKIVSSITAVEEHAHKTQFAIVELELVSSGETIADARRRYGDPSNYCRNGHAKSYAVLHAKFSAWALRDARLKGRQGPAVVLVAP